MDYVNNMNICIKTWWYLTDYILDVEWTVVRSTLITDVIGSRSVAQSAAETDANE